MYTDFELSFRQSGGWLSFFLVEGGQTRASGRQKLSVIEPLLQSALAAEASIADVMQQWITVGEKTLGNEMFSIILARSPARLTVCVDSSIDDSIYDLFRMTPWEQVILHFAENSEAKQSLLADEQSVILKDVRVAVESGSTGESIGAIESVPSELDFYSEMDDHDATGTTFPVWFGTNREIEQSGGQLVGSASQQDLATCKFGKCLIHIPKSHRRGELASPWYRPRSGLTALEISSGELIKQVDFCDSIKKEIQAVDDSTQEHLLFIHGFNNSFIDAILRAGQIGYDIGINGATIAFCWPSHKCFSYLSSYVGDGERISACAASLKKMFRTLEGLSGRLHIIAHSMGNRALLAAWKDAFDQNSLLRLGQVIFAAPDVFQTTFRDNFTGIEEFCERATLYANRRDKALGLARLLSKTPRAGLLPPAMKLEGVDTVESPFNGDLLGHTYFAKAIPVLEDIATMIEKNLSPENRGLTFGESGVWTFEE